MFKAWRDVLQASEINCCRSHFGQAWHRSWRFNWTMAKKAKNQRQDNGFIKLLDCSSSCLKKLKTHSLRSSWKTVRKTRSVLLSQTTPPKPTSSADVMWAHVAKEENKRPNNGPETFHRRLNSMFSTAENLLHIQTDTYIWLWSLDDPSLVRKKSVTQCGNSSWTVSGPKENHNDNT